MSLRHIRTNPSKTNPTGTKKVVALERILISFYSDFVPVGLTLALVKHKGPYHDGHSNKNV